MAAFPNVDKSRPKVAGDVVSAVAVEWVGMGVTVKVSDSMLNNGRIIGLFAGRIRFTHLCIFCSRQEAANGVISGSFGGHSKIT